jgi:hypothetical protein
MSDFKILYPQDDGTVAIVVPADGVTQEQALGAVPSGKQYIITTDNSVIPTDRTFRDAWEVDFTGAATKS